MNKKQISLLIIGAVFVFLFCIGLHWFMQHREQSLRDDLAKRDGIIEMLQQKSKQDSLLDIKKTHIIDSAKATIHLKDTIQIHDHYVKAINNIRNLSTDDNLILFANWLSAQDNN